MKGCRFLQPPAGRPTCRLCMWVRVSCLPNRYTSFVGPAFEAGRLFFAAPKHTKCRLMAHLPPTSLRAQRKPFFDPRVLPGRPDCGSKQSRRQRLFSRRPHRYIISPLFPGSTSSDSTGILFRVLLASRVMDGSAQFYFRPQNSRRGPPTCTTLKSR